MFSTLAVQMCYGVAPGRKHAEHHAVLSRKSAALNLAHRWLCRSAYWRETYILPCVLDGLDMGTKASKLVPALA